MRHLRSRRGQGLLRNVTVVVAVCAVMSLSGGGVQAAPTNAWSVVSTPSRPAPVVNGGLRSVVCPTATSCVTVGQYEDGANSLPLVGHSTGGAWSIASTPAPPGYKFGPLGELVGVACPTRTLCFGVGDYATATSTAAFIDRWNGTNWAIVPTSAPGTMSLLSAISCPTSTSCFAVGYFKPGNGHRTLIEHWNGRSWSIVPSPTPHASGPIYDQLISISCATSASCVAVGTSSDRSIGGQYRPTLGKTFAESWDGKVWRVVKSRDPAGASTLSSVACPTSKSCIAVGTTQNNHLNQALTLAEQWNGSAWSIVPSPGVAGASTNILSGVSCPAVKMCFAVGITTGSQDRDASTLFERWNGTKWSIINKFASTTIGEATAIACPSASNCVAVGAYLIQKWNGSSWSVVTTGGSSGSLARMSCSTPTSCFAVGSSSDYSDGVSFGTYTAGRARTLIERYDGSSWQIVTSPNQQGARSTSLGGISCPAPASCFAVGSSGDDFVSSAFVARWDGTTWSTVPGVPSPPVESGGVSFSYLSDVSCLSPAMCFAVGGHYSSSASTTPLIERWDGAAWSIVSGPEPAGIALVGVSCVSASSCFAVGALGVIEHFDGTSWAVVPSPAPPGTELISISCPASTNCFATGSTADLAGFDGASKTLVERWDGTAWSLVANPNPPKEQSAALLGVTCPTASKCVAVGDSSTAGPDEDTRPTSTLVEQWNGTTWSIVPSANPRVAAFPTSPTYSDLFGVSCVPSAGCIAVGGYGTQQTGFTLAERAP